MLPMRQWQIINAELRERQLTMTATHSNKGLSARTTEAEQSHGRLRCRAAEKCKWGACAR